MGKERSLNFGLPETKINLNLPDFIKEDFTKLVKKITEIKEERQGNDENKLTDLELLQDCWFEGITKLVDYSFKREPIGKPEDYLEIRNDYSALKNFFIDILDKGKVMIPIGRDLDVINYPEYIVWLYYNSDNKIFKKNIEKITLELLKPEIDKKFSPPDIDLEKKELKEYSIYRRGGEYSEEDMNRLAFKNALGNENYYKQFFRLTGLIDIIQRIGDDSDNFTEIYEVLKKKAYNDKTIVGLPPIHYPGERYIPYQHFLWSLAKLQKGNDLEKFWINNLRICNHNDGLLATVYGLLNMNKEEEKKNKTISTILEVIEERDFFEKMKCNNERDLSVMVFEHISDRFPSWTGWGHFHYFDRGEKAFYYLEKHELEKNKHLFEFRRFTKEGEKRLFIQYDPINNSFEGDKKNDFIVKKFFEREDCKTN